MIRIIIIAIKKIDFNNKLIIYLRNLSKKIIKL